MAKTNYSFSLAAIAERVKNADTHSARETLEREAGVRYSDLLRLPYFDIVRCHLVDPMFNLFLGIYQQMNAYNLGRQENNI